MSRRRRPPRRVRSVSCTDGDWERVRRRATRRGLSISRYLVECGLTVDPGAEPARLALDEAEQRSLYDGVVGIAARMSEAGSEETVLTQIRNALTFLMRARMREMVEAGRGEELHALLARLYDERAAGEILETVGGGVDADRAER